MVKRKKKSNWAKWRDSCEGRRRCLRCPKQRVCNKTLCSDCLRACSTRSKEYQQRLKIEVFEAYGGIVCACCKETNIKFLTLDHDAARIVDYKHRAGFRLYNELKKKGFPAGFRVLCYNCNMGRSANGGACPHTE